MRRLMGSLIMSACLLSTTPAHAMDDGGATLLLLMACATPLASTGSGLILLADMLGSASNWMLDRIDDGRLKRPRAKVEYFAHAIAGRMDDVPLAEGSRFELIKSDAVLQKVSLSPEGTGGSPNELLRSWREGQPGGELKGSKWPLRVKVMDSGRMNRDVHLALYVDPQVESSSREQFYGIHLMFNRAGSSNGQVVFESMSREEAEHLAEAVAARSGSPGLKIEVSDQRTSDSSRPLSEFETLILTVKGAHSEAEFIRTNLSLLDQFATVLRARGLPIYDPAPKTFRGPMMFIAM